MIEASFFKQYGIRLRTAELEYTEFLNLLSCLMQDTPLGQIIAIRSETDVNVIKCFSKEQKRIRDEWVGHKGEKRDSQKYQESMDRLFSMALA